MKITITIEIDERENGVSTTESREDHPGPYVRFFDVESAYWKPYGLLGCSVSDTNLMFVTQMQLRANDLLKCQGYLTLGEVYHLLGVRDVSEEEINAGWIYDDPMSDESVVDFGIFKTYNRDFINSDWRKGLLLSFNAKKDIWKT